MSLVGTMLTKAGFGVMSAAGQSRHKLEKGGFRLGPRKRSRRATETTERFCCRKNNYRGQPVQSAGPHGVTQPTAPRRNDSTAKFGRACFYSGSQRGDRCGPASDTGTVLLGTGQTPWSRFAILPGVKRHHQGRIGKSVWSRSRFGLSMEKRDFCDPHHIAGKRSQAIYQPWGGGQCER